MAGSRDDCALGVDRGNPENQHKIVLITIRAPLDVVPRQNHRRAIKVSYLERVLTTLSNITLSLYLFSFQCQHGSATSQESPCIWYSKAFPVTSSTDGRESAST